jgi:hypothetical protein
MKRIIQSLAVAALALGGAAAARAQFPYTQFTNTAGTVFIKVTGNVTQDARWTANNVYILDKLIFVTAPAKLTIEPGTIIRGEQPTTPGTSVLNPADPGTLIIARGAKLVANGTGQAPIIWTSIDDPYVPGGTQTIPPQTNGATFLPSSWRNYSPSGPSGQNAAAYDGTWGGLLMMGRTRLAQGNVTGTNFTDITVAGGTINAGTGADYIEGFQTFAEGVYGGTDDDDNSGVLRYHSHRYGGFVLSDNNEINGLTLGAVGRGTTIEFIEVYNNADDGVEFFGGTVNTKYMASLFNGDDGFDWDEGFRGNGQFWFVIQDNTGATATYTNAALTASGPLLTVTNISSELITGGIRVTVATEGAHSINAAERTVVSLGTNSALNGQFLVDSVLDTNVFTYSLTGSLVTNASSASLPNMRAVKMATTARTTAPHTLNLGDFVTVAGANPAYLNGSVKVTDIPSVTNYTYSPLPASLQIVRLFTNSGGVSDDVLIVTGAGHGLVSGEQVLLTGSSQAPLNGVFVVNAAPAVTTTSFTITASGLAGAGVNETSAGSKAYGPVANAPTAPGTAAQSATGRSIVNFGDKLIEADGPEAVVDGSGRPYSIPTIFNATFIGRSASSVRSGENTVNFKSNSGGKLFNSLILDTDSTNAFTIPGNLTGLNEGSIQTIARAYYSRLTGGVYNVNTDAVPAGEPDTIFGHNIFSRIGTTSAGYLTNASTTNAYTIIGGGTNVGNVIAGSVPANTQSTANEVLGDQQVTSIGRENSGLLNPILTNGAAARTSAITPTAATAYGLHGASNFFTVVDFKGAFLDNNWLSGWSVLEDANVLAPGTTMSTPTVTVSNNGTDPTVIFTGVSGFKYSVEYSTDMKTYIPLKVEVGTGAASTVTNTGRGLSSATFYRVIGL